MNSLLFSRTFARHSFARAALHFTNTNIINPLTRFNLPLPPRYYSSSSLKTSPSRKSKSKTKPTVVAAIMTEKDQKPNKKKGFFVVRKGDIVGVYNNLIDCQAQVGSSVCDPAVSVYKSTDAMSKEAEAYLLSRGLRNALYSINAVDLTEDLFGTLVPCPFQLPHVVEPDIMLFHRVLESQPGRGCILEFDGACKGNPGVSGGGAVIRSPDGKLLYRVREGLGVATNNVAEYRAMILGLRYALSKGFTSISVVGDSKLVCMQIQGLWRVRNENISKWYEEAKKLKDEFLYFQINHVLRHKNSDADAQANLGAVLEVGQVEEEEVDTGKIES
ncbi:ribonuclease H [Artemisia annua]|uniref:Ribonuclease H n=1 Tax=Artemisia annua TaxID=35608 RepID=A0A2U1P3J3_ARTAN|nr:ribonuclease H [Artemisia annua]